MNHPLEFRELLDRAPSGIILVFRNSLWTNAAVSRICGLGDTDISSMQTYFDAVSAAFPPTDRRKHRPGLDDLRKLGCFESEILAITHRDGRPRWVEHRFESTDRGEILMLNDVTERTEQEQRTRTQMRLLDRVSRQGQIGGFEMDIATKTQVWSDQMYRMQGIDLHTPVTEELALQPFSPEDQVRLQEGLLQTMRDGISTAIELRFAGKDCTERWIHLIGDVDIENGIPVRAVGTVQDVTERHHSSVALREATLKAEAASRAKSEFLANMSHEIRTPMNGVIGMTELLLETPLRDTQRDYAQTVLHSAKALLTVINDILDFSRVEAGKLQLECIDLDLRETVHEVGRLLAVQAHAKELELTIEVDPRVPERVRGDAGRLRQILLNLGGNAVKFTKQGEVSIGVKAVESDARGSCLRFDIRDTGIGVPEDRLPVLFQPFSQVDSSNAREFGGSGLGLSIVRHLVTLMGGTVGVQSQPQVGSCFWFTAKFAAGAAAQGSARIPSRSLQHLRVLVVDDNATNRKVLEGHLKQFGCDSQCSASADEAFDLMGSAAQAGCPFDVALIDHQMPGRHGADLGRQINDDPVLKSTRLVLLTSSGRKGQGQYFAELGFAGYLLKPIAQRDLMDCLLVTGEASAEPWHAQTQPIVTEAELGHLRSRRPRRILVAEDNLVNQKVTRRFLEKMGYEVAVAANGKVAVEAWEHGAFDLILMDCQMPELDGYQATLEIRKREQGSAHIPIVALTAHAMQGADSLCKAAGMDGYLTKPIDRAQLRASLDDLLGEDLAAGAA